MFAGDISEHYIDWRNNIIPPQVSSWFESDIVFANLESVSSNRGHRLPGKVVFYSKAEPLELLRDLNVNVVNLANNHIMDYGFTAVEDTMAQLRNLGIQYAGVGKNLALASKPALLEKVGKIIAVLCFSWTSEWKQPVPAATNDSPGVNPLTKEHVHRNIKEVNRNYAPDLIVVSLHWGESKSRFPRPDSVKFARAIIDAGADVVVGHHTHCLQGFEVYKQRPIFYSLGNFISSPYWRSPDQSISYGKEGVRRTRNLRERKTLIVNLSMTNRKLEGIQFLPLLQLRDEVRLVLPEEKMSLDILKTFTQVSSFLKKPTYSQWFPWLRRADELIRIWGDFSEEGVKGLTWRTPFRIVRKLASGRNFQ